MGRLPKMGLAMFVLALLIGCDEGGGKILENAQPNLGPRSLALTSLKTANKAVYRRGEPIQIDYSISSSGISANDVLVTFSLVPLREMNKLIAGPNEETDVTDVLLGSDLVDVIAPGFMNRSVNLVIPEDILGDEEYLVLASVDPEGAVDEDGNPGDNSSRGFAVGIDHPTRKTITVANEFINDLSIENAEVGDGFILLEVPAASLALASTESQVVSSNFNPRDDIRESNMIGHIDVKKLGSDSMSAVIQVDVIVGGEETPALMWNGEGSNWVMEARYDVPSANEVYFVPWDIRLSDAQRSSMLEAYDPELEENIATFRFRIIQTGGEQDENLDNNSFELDVPYRFFISDEVALEVARGGDGDVELSVSRTSALKALPGGGETRAMSSLFGKPLASFKNLLKKQMERIAEENAKTNVLFTKSFSDTYGDKSKAAITFGASSFNRISENSIGTLSKSIKVDGHFFDRDEPLSEGSASISANVATGEVSFSRRISIFGKAVIEQQREENVAVSYELEREWEEEKEFFDKKFRVGPVPVKVTIGAKGTISVGSALGYESGVIQATGNLLQTTLRAFGEGGTDVLGFGGGVRVNLVLINNKIEAVAKADLSRLPQNIVKLEAALSNRLKAIEGEFEIFGSYSYLKRWFKRRTAKEYLTIYKTGSAIDKEWFLLRASKTVRVQN